MTTEVVKKSIWSWKFFSQDFLKMQQDNMQAKSSVGASLFLAFFIVIVSAQMLGFANTVYNKKMLLQKYKNVNVIVYSNIG